MFVVFVSQLQEFRFQFFYFFVVVDFYYVLVGVVGRRMEVIVGFFIRDSGLLCYYLYILVYMLGDINFWF